MGARKGGKPPVDPQEGGKEMQETNPGEGKPHGSESRKKGGIIGFRVDATERAEIEAAAEAAGLTIGSFVRDTMLRRVSTKPTRRPSLDRVLLSQLLGQLGKLGGNLNQIARRLNAGAGVGADRITAACDELWILKDEILKAIRRLDYDSQGQVQSSGGAISGLPPDTGKE